MISESVKRVLRESEWVSSHKGVFNKPKNYYNLDKDSDDEETVSTDQSRFATSSYGNRKGAGGRYGKWTFDLGKE